MRGIVNQMSGLGMVCGTGRYNNVLVGFMWRLKMSRDVGLGGYFLGNFKLL